MANERGTLVLGGPLLGRDHWRTAAERAGWTVVERLLVETVPIRFEWPDGPLDGLLLTSSSSLRALLEHRQRWRGLPAAVVGRASARRAREAGLDVVHCAPRDAQQLARGLARHFPAGSRLLWLHGNRSQDAGDLFQARGFTVVRAMAYATRPTADASALPRCDAFLLTSPSGVQRATELGLAETGARFLCLGAATAAALEGELGAPFEVLDEPTPEALVKCLERR